MDLDICRLVYEEVPHSGISEVPIILWVILIICIFFSAFFSMSETAFSSMNEVRMNNYAEQGKKGSKKALKVYSNFDNSLSSILIGNNIVNIGAATIGANIFAHIILNANLADIISTLVITIVVLTFGEILPKSMAKSNPEAVAMKVAVFIYAFNIIFKPLNMCFIGLRKLVSRNNSKPTVTEEELTSIVEGMADDGVIENQESVLIKAVLDLNDKTVEDIMIPRIDMVAINVNDDISHIKKIFFENHYSRIPVFQDDKDTIIGILYERDFYIKLVKNQKLNIRSIMKPAKFVSKSTKVDDLIHDLQASKVHLAIVSGEYGETAGVVTMEDALEELVGEIYDEHDETKEEMIKKIAEEEYEVDGAMELDDLFDMLKLGKEPACPYNKLSGWLYELDEHVPTVGDQITYVTEFIAKDDENEYVDVAKRLTFTIQDVSERRIMKVFLKVEDVDLTNEEA